MNNQQLLFFLHALHALYVFYMYTLSTSCPLLHAKHSLTDVTHSDLVISFLHAVSNTPWRCLLFR